LAKRTAIIDLGSKSFRLVVFERTSRFGFCIIKEAKAMISMGKNIHKNNGVLQTEDFIENISILKQFAHIINSLKVRKTLCIATSIIRDAPNSNEFKNQVLKQTGLKIKIIDGEKEAYLGAISTLNLLPIKDFITMDIGGGSTELSLIINKNIKYKISLDIGAVRLRSIFGKDKFDKSKIDLYINNLIDKIPPEFKNYPLVAIGGTARTIAKNILPENYPIAMIHGFEFEVNNLFDIYNTIISSSKEQLSTMKISKDRLNDIKMGVSIFANIAKRLNTSRIITSGVGIREGLFLNDLLKSHHGRFPQNFHIGMKNLVDKFVVDKKLLKSQKNHISKLFDILTPIHKLDNNYKKYLSFALTIFQSSATIDIHKTHEYSRYIVTHSSIYNLSHYDKYILSIMMKYSVRKLIKEKDYKKRIYNAPEFNTIYWLSFMNMFIINLLFDNQKSFAFNLKDNTLEIINTNDINLIEQNNIKSIDIPKDITISFIN
jgi:exopolyphosphatase/guanosine-5'-triphosphate,3'-diphosphate pyrophosphatase